ncbi:MAG: septation protein IspZ [Gammaproteobacteria bacterium]|nr:septation protein IspZ [Gammaproteobacteria bacterium]MCY4358259.1 septation protein IspZ [Gammaproteobacteria bacterium]
MKQLIDYIPLLVFFSVWAMDERSVTIVGIEHSIGGIFSAAEFLLLASILVYGSLLVVQRRLDKFQWITVGAVILFCIPTIIFRDTNFLKWKAPIVNWIFATLFFVSQFIGKKPAIEHMMGNAIEAPKQLWLRLNTVWIGYFIALGAVNLAVAYLLSEALWIQFKVFGNLILTFVFVVGQMPFLIKYAKVEDGSLTESSTEESA